MEETLLFIPPGKIRCFITGKLRQDKPEEHIRQRIARSVIEEYGYSKADVEIEFPIKMGTKKKKADIAIFHEGSPHKQENIFIIVETKQENIKPTDREEGIEQLKSYMAASLGCRYGLWVGSELQAFEKIERATNPFEPITDIPPKGLTETPRITYDKLIPAREGLRDIFKRCHNYIHGNQGLPKDQAFQELLKVIFCKVHDESVTSGKMRFDVTNEEKKSELGQRKLRNRMEEIFDEVKDKYSYIFKENERIELYNRVLAYIVGELRKYTLLDTDTDVKGEAYEEIVGANLRGDRGEFFTPRNVCKMAVDIVFATYPNDKLLKLKILDPACGTAGFLVSAMNRLREIIHEKYRDKWKDEARLKSEVRDILKDTCDSNFFGIDFNPLLARTAQMNLVMNGDGSSNVYHTNSLLPAGEWPDEEGNDVKTKIQLGKFDIVFTNPPFGSNIPIDDPHILDQFELSRFDANSPRASMPPEQIFVERCLQLLKPGGRMAIVLPDSILSNPGLVFIRRWIFEKARIIASIDMPTETFEPFTGTQTSILVLQKKTEEEIRIEKAGGRIDYDVFMSIPQTVGHDRRGNPVYLRTPEGEIILENESQIKDDSLPYVIESFREWWEKEQFKKGEK